MFLIYVFFFFQAEDGIRDHCVTGVQTCALPIWRERMTFVVAGGGFAGVETVAELNDFVRGAVRYYPRVRPEEIRVVLVHSDRKSTRLNSSHTVISYAVFCLKKKNKTKK